MRLVRLHFSHLFEIFQSGTHKGTFLVVVLYYHQSPFFPKNFSRQRKLKSDHFSKRFPGRPTNNVLKGNLAQFSAIYWVVFSKKSLGGVHESFSIFMEIFFSIFRDPNFGLEMMHISWKLLKISHLNFWILVFSTNICPIDLSGNTFWPQLLGFQKLI